MYVLYIILRDLYNCNPEPTSAILEKQSSVGNVVSHSDVPAS